MSVSVSVPTILRPVTKGEKTVTADGATVAELIADLDSRYYRAGRSPGQERCAAPVREHLRQRRGRPLHRWPGDDRRRRRPADHPAGRCRRRWGLSPS